MESEPRTRRGRRSDLPPARPAEDQRQGYGTARPVPTCQGVKTRSPSPRRRRRANSLQSPPGTSASHGDSVSPPSPRVRSTSRTPAGLYGCNAKRCFRIEDQREPGPPGRGPPSGRGPADPPGGRPPPPPEPPPGPPLEPPPGRPKPRRGFRLEPRRGLSPIALGPSGPVRSSLKVAGFPPFLGIASLMTRARPRILVPASDSMASRPRSSSRIMMIAKPRRFPVALSSARAMSSMGPNRWKSR